MACCGRSRSSSNVITKLSAASGSSVPHKNDNNYQLMDNNNILCGRKTQVVCEGEYSEKSPPGMTTAYDMLTSEQENWAKFIISMSDICNKRGGGVQSIFVVVRCSIIDLKLV